jgi:hypothetical protein
MDVQALVDDLARLVEEARPVPLTDQVRVDPEEIFDLLDQLRAAIPDQVKQARQLVRDRQESLAHAQKEAERLLTDAREQVARLYGQEEIARLAERQAAERLLTAQSEAGVLVATVEDWADQHLALLETNLDAFLGAIRRGRAKLQERSAESAARASVGAHASAS